MPDPEEEYITLREAAARSGLSYSQLRLLARSGRIAAKRIGHFWVTTPAAVAAYLNDPEARSHDPLKYRRRPNSSEK